LSISQYQELTPISCGARPAQYAADAEAKEVKPTQLPF
jgi:hypothetical protein